MKHGDAGFRRPQRREQTPLPSLLPVLAGGRTTPAARSRRGKWERAASRLACHPPRGQRSHRQPPSRHSPRQAVVAHRQGGGGEHRAPFVADTCARDRHLLLLLSPHARPMQHPRTLAAWPPRPPLLGGAIAGAPLPPPPLVLHLGQPTQETTRGWVPRVAARPRARTPLRGGGGGPPRRARPGVHGRAADGGASGRGPRSYAQGAGGGGRAASLPIAVSADPAGRVAPPPSPPRVGRQGARLAVPLSRSSFPSVSCSLLLASSATSLCTE